MTTDISVAEVARLAAQLSAQEQLQLVEKIVHDLAAGSAMPVPVRGRAWREIRGRVDFPLFGEDAQEWITRTRHEGDENRQPR